MATVCALWDYIIDNPVSEEERNQRYNDASTIYEQETGELNLAVKHGQFANRIADLFPERIESVEILDIGAGTGLLGKELKKRGFKNVDGLDPAEKMIDKARADDVYRNVFVGDLEKYLSMESTGKYDAVVSAGVLLPNHLPPTDLKKACKLLKQGGYLSFLTRGFVFDNQIDYSKDVIQNLQELEDAKIMRKIAWEPLKKYHGVLGGTGMNILYQKL